MLIEKCVVKQFKFLREHRVCEVHDMNYVHKIANRLGFLDLAAFVDNRGWEGYQTLLEDYTKWMEIYEIDN